MNQLLVAASPHERAPLPTWHIMLCVLLALLPAALAGCMNFGMRALILLLVTTGSAVIFEFLCRILMKRPQTIGDLSAAVTGLLLGMNLPPDLPYWQAAIASFVAIVMVKQLFGGLGQNFANPTVVARIVLMLSFTSTMTTFRFPHTDAVSSATPLTGAEATYWDLLFGNTAGCIGETCALGLLLGGIYLCLRGIISPAAPISFIGSFALCTWIAGNNPLTQVLSGGLMLGAVFMATDYVTTPLTAKGKLLFGIGCGCLTFVIRQFGGYPEGVSFSILLMNLLTPYIDRITASRPFGTDLAKKEVQNNA